MRGFLRTTERPRDSSETVRGVRVARWSKRLGPGGQPEAVEVPGQVWMFPGSDAQVGMILANISLPESVLKAPDVSVEYGVRTGDGWLREEILKAHAL